MDHEHAHGAGAFAELPDELVVEIAGELDAPSLLALGATCRALRPLAHNEHLWRRLCAAVAPAWYAATCAKGDAADFVLWSAEYRKRRRSGQRFLRNKLVRTDIANVHTSTTRALDLDDRRNLLVSGGYDGYVIVHRLNDAQDSLETLASTLGHTDYTFGVKIMQDRLLSVGRDRLGQMWDLASLRQLGTLTGHTGFVKSCAWDPTANLIVTGSTDNSIMGWDPRTYASVFTLTGHTNDIRTINMSSTRVFSGADDSTARVWDLRQQSQLAQWKCAGLVHGTGLDGDVAAAAAFNGELTLFNLKTLEVTHKMRAVSYGVYWMMMDDDKIVVVGPATEAAIVNRHDPSEYRQLLRMPPFNSMMSGVSCGGEMFATGSGEGAIHLFHASDEEAVNDQQNMLSRLRPLSANSSSSNDDHDGDDDDDDGSIGGFIGLDDADDDDANAGDDDDTPN